MFWHCNQDANIDCFEGATDVVVYFQHNYWYFCYVTEAILQLYILFGIQQWASCQIRKNCRLCMHRECQERAPRHRGLATPTCITTRAWRTCRDACRNRELAVSFQVAGGENGPSIPGECTNRNFTYMVRGKCWPEFGDKYRCIIQRYDFVYLTVFLQQIVSGMASCTKQNLIILYLCDAIAILAWTQGSVSHVAFRYGGWREYCRSSIPISVEDVLSVQDEKILSVLSLVKGLIIRNNNVSGVLL